MCAQCAAGTGLGHRPVVLQHVTSGAVRDGTVSSRPDLPAHGTQLQLIAVRSDKLARGARGGETPVRASKRGTL